MATLVTGGATSAWASFDVRRDLGHLRATLMGEAYVAVGDEYSTLYYNPAGPGRSPANVNEVIAVTSFQYNDLVKSGLTDPDALSAKYQNLTPAQFKSLLGTELYAQFTPLRTLVARESGWALGFSTEALLHANVLGNPVLPSLRLEVFADTIMFMSFYGKWGDDFAVGMTPKVIQRYGLDKVFTFGDLFAGGGTLDLKNNPDFKSIGNGYASGGVDLGWIWDLPFAESWHPRIGWSSLNIGGYDSVKGLRGIQFGKRPTPFDPPLGGELPQLNTIGFAVSPEHIGIRYTVAVDIVDVTETVLPGDDLALRTRVGVEVGFGIHKDGTALFSVFGGYNANQPSIGILARDWIFEVGIGRYTVQIDGTPDPPDLKAGRNTDTRNVFLFAFKF